MSRRTVRPAGIGLLPLLILLVAWLAVDREGPDPDSAAPVKSGVSLGPQTGNIAPPTQSGPRPDPQPSPETAPSPSKSLMGAAIPGRAERRGADCADTRDESPVLVQGMVTDPDGKPVPDALAELFRGNHLLVGSFLSRDPAEPSS